MNLTMQLVPFSSSDGVNPDILDDPSKSHARGGVDSPGQFLMGMDESGLISQASQLKQVQRGTQPASFDEEVSGVNLSKLFSVYGPNSKQRRPRTKGRQDPVGKQRISIGELAKGQVAKNIKSYDNMVRGRPNQSAPSGSNAQLPAVGLDGTEPDLNDRNNIQLLRRIF